MTMARSSRDSGTSYYYIYLSKVCSIEDGMRSGRSSTITDDVINEVEQGATNQCKKDWSRNEHFER